MEWFFPCYWTAAVDPAACWGTSAPRPAGPIGDDQYARISEHAEPDVGPVDRDLDLDVVRIVYGVIAERIACGLCGAPLDPAAEAERTRGFFAGARTTIVVHCRGPRRHRHSADVIDRAGDLRLGELRPA